MAIKDPESNYLSPLFIRSFDHGKVKQERQGGQVGKRTGTFNGTVEQGCKL